MYVFGFPHKWMNALSIQNSNLIFHSKVNGKPLVSSENSLK